MKIWITIPLATAFLVSPSALLPAACSMNVLGDDAPQEDPPAGVPLYRVTVVQGSAMAINYRNLRSSTKVDLKGTVLAPKASGIAKVKSEDGAIHIVAKFEDLPAAGSFGPEFLTYVMWGISPEGKATNLGEVLLKHGKGKIKVVESLQTFGLVVTAEPYFAVNQPSNVVVLENAARDNSDTQVEPIAAKYDLLRRGQYTLNLASAEPLAVDDRIPFEVLQARNAVRIAQASGAPAYASEGYAKAQGYLLQAESEQGSRKARIMMARESIQRAEDARLIAVQRQATDEANAERALARTQLDEANRKVATAAAAHETALEQGRASERENVGLRSANEGLRSRNEGLQSANEGLRSELLTQLNAILETRATSRGLIVSMSGVLFQNGKARLLSPAREKLAKIAGILAVHKGIKIEAEGYTDSMGSDALNLRLSEQRADNVKRYLVSQGVPASSIGFRGYGKDSPVASNDTDAGRQENRRVELVVSGEGLTAADRDM